VRQSDGMALTPPDKGISLAMTIRPIRPEELEAYSALGGADWLTDAVRRFWAEGLSSPDVCFVAESDGKPVGRAFFHHPPSSTTFDLFALYVDPSFSFLEAGRELLAEALARLTASGAAGAWYAIYDIYDRNPGLTQPLIESLGFRQYQEKRRHVWRDKGTAVEVPSRLELRSLAVVGEDAFTEAARRVTEGTLDRSDQADLAKHGLGAAGRMYMKILKDVEFLPDEWQLGYLADGRLCGLVVPQKIFVENEGSINYIGVVPELRGSGYGFDLLLKGTALPAEARPRSGHRGDGRREPSDARGAGAGRPRTRGHAAGLLLRPVADGRWRSALCSRPVACGCAALEAS
jgi:ribosomal protein S18 acetylase RimI-like enzyme